METITIVAFRYNQKRSILYRNHTDIEAILADLRHALTKLKADVISIRRVHSEL